MDNSKYLDELAKEAEAGKLLRLNIQKMKDDSLNRLSQLQNAKTSALAQLNVKSFEELSVTSPNQTPHPNTNIIQVGTSPQQESKDICNAHIAHTEHVNCSGDVNTPVKVSPFKSNSKQNADPSQNIPPHSSTASISSNHEKEIESSNFKDRTMIEQPLEKLTENELKTQSLLETFKRVSSSTSTSPKLTLHEHRPSIQWNISSREHQNNSSNEVISPNTSLFDDDLDHDMSNTQYVIRSFDRNQQEQQEAEEVVEEEDVIQEKHVEESQYQDMTSSQILADMNDDEFVFDVPMSTLNKHEGVDHINNSPSAQSSPSYSPSISNRTSPVTPSSKYHSSATQVSDSSYVTSIRSEGNIVKQTDVELPGLPNTACSSSESPSSELFSEQRLEDLFALIEQQHRVLVQMGLSS